jgi:hypothetical protein
MQFNSDLFFYALYTLSMEDTNIIQKGWDIFTKFYVFSGYILKSFTGLKLDKSLAVYTPEQRHFLATLNLKIISNVSLRHNLQIISGCSIKSAEHYSISKCTNHRHVTHFHCCFQLCNLREESNVQKLLKWK